MGDSLLLRHGLSNMQFAGIVLISALTTFLLLLAAIDAAVNERLVVASVLLLLVVACACGFIYGSNHADDVVISENRKSFSSSYSVSASEMDGMGVVGSAGRDGGQISVGDLMDGRHTGFYQVKYNHDGVIQDITVQIDPSDDGNRLKVYDSKGRLIRPGTPIASRMVKG